MNVKSCYVSSFGHITEVGLKKNKKKMETKPDEKANRMNSKA